MPYKIPAKAGAPYRPSNGIEGDMFMERFCHRCQLGTDETGGCPIIDTAFWRDIGEPEYPKELTHDSEGCPTCTSFAPASGAGSD